MKKFIEREPLKVEHPRLVFTDLQKFEQYLEKMKGYAGSKVYNSDLTLLDFSSEKGQELLSKINGFDENTVWPENLKLEKEKQLQLGKDSGLGISSLHKNGYTGKGINIAIIDQQLLVNHPEYQENIRYYREMGNEESLQKYGHLPDHGAASYHGPAVASLAVGKHCGSAPEAGLFFIAEGGCHSPEVCLKAIKHLIDLNKKSSEKDKIRCLSCSWGGGPKEKDFDERMKLFKELEDTGCMVLGGLYGDYMGRSHSGGSRIHLGSDALDNLKGEQYANENMLIVPRDQRTFASNSGGYLYEEKGGESWTYPYLAGLVACALQANPEIVKQKGWQETVWKKLLETARLTLDHKGKIVQPESFVQSIINVKKKSLKKTLNNASHAKEILTVQKGAQKN